MAARSFIFSFFFGDNGIKNKGNKRKMSDQNGNLKGLYIPGITSDHPVTSGLEAHYGKHSRDMLHGQGTMKSLDKQGPWLTTAWDMHAELGTERYI